MYIFVTQKIIIKNLGKILQTKISEHKQTCQIFTGPCQPVSGWGVYSKIWAPFLPRAPPKNFFRKAKIFPENVRDGGEGRRYFFENKSSRNLSQNFQRRNPSFFKNFAIPACQGPLPASWAPHTPPGGTALNIHLICTSLVFLNH